MNLFNFTPGLLIASLLWSSVGAGFWIYGKKQQEIVPLCVGIALTVVSWFVGSVLTMSLIGVGLILAALWLRRQF